MGQNVASKKQQIIPWMESAFCTSHLGQFLSRLMVREPKSSKWWNVIDLAICISTDNDIVHA